MVGALALTVAVVACQVGSTSSPTTEGAAPIASCRGTDLGRTTAVPVEPGPTTLGAGSIPFGDVPMGRYAAEAFLNVAAPCWRRLEDPASGTLLLARSDVPGDRLAFRIAHRSMADPCSPGSTIEPTAAAVEDWIAARGGLEVTDRVETTLDEQPAVLLGLRATDAGGCDGPSPSLEAGDDALFELPLLADRSNGQVGRVLVADGPVQGSVALVVVTADGADALASFRPIADPLVDSLDFITATP